MAVPTFASFADEKNLEVQLCQERIKELEHFIHSKQLKVPNQRWKLPQVLVRINSDALIERSRNIICSEFLAAPGAGDILLFVDDDIVFTNKDVSITIETCLEKKGVVGGIYPLRSDLDDALPLHPLDHKDGTIIIGSGDPIEARFVSSGFMAIHRKVLEKFSKNTQYFKRHVPPFYNFFATSWTKDPKPGWEEYDFFRSEDWHFCDRARELGFQIWIEPKVVLKHAGQKLYSAYDSAETIRVDDKK